MTTSCRQAGRVSAAAHRRQRENNGSLLSGALDDTTHASTMHARGGRTVSQRHRDRCHKSHVHLRFAYRAAANRHGGSNCLLAVNDTCAATL